VTVGSVRGQGGGPPFCVPAPIGPIEPPTHIEMWTKCMTAGSGSGVLFSTVRNYCENMMVGYTTRWGVEP